MSTPNPPTDKTFPNDVFGYNSDSPMAMGRPLDFGPPLDGPDSTIRARQASAFDSPAPPSVRLVASLRLPSSPLDEIAPDDMGDSRSFLGSAEAELSAPIPEDDEEQGRRLACEFLENDFSSMSQEKVAIFLGGP
jgi:hypothetical protein